MSALEVITSSLLSVTHGFPTRAGGVSVARYATLNLAGKWGDDANAVAENRRRLARHAGFDDAQLFTARQVHGDSIIVVTAADAPSEIAPREADALVTDAPNATLGILTADCVPILFSDNHGRIAAAHAGWRGTVKNIAAKTVDALVALGASRDHIRAALGPSICVRCFEVGPEVAAEFATVDPATIRTDLGEKPHVDLQLANRLLLERAGIASHNIDATPPCTHHDEARFFSFRRDGGNIGQHLSFITR